MVKSAAYRNPQIVAAYFQDQIVAAADKLGVLEADFTLKATYDFCLYPKIKILEDSFFVYSPGSYSRGASVTYDGYCKQYDKTNRLVFGQVFEVRINFLKSEKTASAITGNSAAAQKIDHLSPGGL